MASTRASESARIACRHRSGSVGLLLGGDVRRRNRNAPKRDYLRDNMRAIRSLQQRVRQTREEKVAPAAHETFKLKQFDNIPARLHRPPPSHFGESISSGQSPITFTPPPRAKTGASVASATPSPASAKPRQNQCRARSLGFDRGSRLHRTLEYEDEQKRTSCQASVADDSEDSGPDADALERSVMELRRMQLSQPKQCRGALAEPCFPNADSHRVDSGPAWWPATDDGRFDGSHAEEQSETFTVPLGYRMIPENERLEILASLRRKLSDLNGRYAHQPLRIETEGQKKKQQALRDKMRETESAVSLFSRPGVFVEA